MEEQKFTTVIEPKNGWFDFHFKELLQYKDLIFLFVKRNFTSNYKQTILGPAWAIIQPFLTSVMFTLVFGNIAGLAAAGVPSFIYYFCANIVWQYFSGCLTATSATFTANAGILGKVYFPRLVMPISTVLSQLISFAIQFMFFMFFWVYYMIVPSGLQPNAYMLLFPLLILQLALLGLGFGIIISACTTKYRDLAMLVGFGTQLWMYATPVAYDISYIPEGLMDLYMLNPVTPVVLTMRYAFLGTGFFALKYYLIGWGTTLVILCIGVVLFNRVEKTFMDTV
ncbi:MAG: ABC transporter permease [Lachnospiraceae bacterium]|nr:ABC transporter permease [Lachnospiraceae bacterium]